MSCVFDSLHYLLINHGKYSQIDDLKSIVKKICGGNVPSTIDEDIVEKVLKKYGLTFFKHFGDPFLPVSYVLCNGKKWISITWKGEKFRSNEDLVWSVPKAIDYLRDNEFLGGFYVLPIENDSSTGKKNNTTSKRRQT